MKLSNVAQALAGLAFLGGAASSANAIPPPPAAPSPLTKQSYLEYKSVTGSALAPVGIVTLTEGGLVGSIFTTMSVNVTLFNSATFDNGFSSNGGQDAFVWNMAKNTGSTPGNPSVPTYSISGFTTSNWSNDSSHPAAINSPFQPSPNSQPGDNANDYFTSGVSCTTSACNVSTISFLVTDSLGVSFGPPINDGSSNAAGSAFVSTSGYTATSGPEDNRNQLKYNGWWFAAAINPASLPRSHDCDDECASLTQVWAARDFITVSAVPEPSEYAMLLAGLGLMGFIARRRKQAA